VAIGSKAVGLGLGLPFTADAAIATRRQTLATRRIRNARRLLFAMAVLDRSVSSLQGTPPMCHRPL
jgi:hypothetical protein